MTEQIKKGKVVKFRDGNGALNGGTVVEIIKGTNGRIALINTLDGKNIQKPLGNLFLVKRQERGRISNKFLNNLSEELDKANKEAGVEKEVLQDNNSELLPPPVSLPSSVEYIEDSLQKKISTLEEIILQKEKEIDFLKDQISSLSINKKTEIAINGLSDALISLSIENNSQPNTIQILAETILKLNK